MLRQFAQRNHSSSKNNKNTFIPFEKQRDSIGRIIKPKTHTKSAVNILQLFENIKKSTKEYFFQKEFEKMQKKLKHIKNSLQEKQIDIDKQIEECMKIGIKLSDIEINSERNKQNLYIYLRQNIGENIQNVKSRLHHHKSHTKSPEYILNQVNGPSPPKTINKQLFRNLGKKSEMMATFCSAGLKYRNFVEKKKFIPWNKWYQNQDFEVFPGKCLRTKCLQKKLF